jgi:hypothetical protein
MHEVLTVALALLVAAPQPTADSGHCDSKPFTLKKPVAAPAKPAPAVAPAPKPAAPKVAAAVKPAKPKKYEIGCKQPKG